MIDVQLLNRSQGEQIWDVLACLIMKSPSRAAEGEGFT